MFLELILSENSLFCEIVVVDEHFLDRLFDLLGGYFQSILFFALSNLHQKQVIHSLYHVLANLNNPFITMLPSELFTIINFS